MFEYYMEKFEVLSYRDDAVWQTNSLGCAWFRDEEVDMNQPRKTNVMFVAASDDFARNNSTIRRQRDEQEASG